MSRASTVIPTSSGGNGGYLFLVPAPARESDLVCAGVMPFIEWAALISYPDASSLIWAHRFKEVDGSSTIQGVETLVAYLIAVTGYGLGVVVISRGAVQAFNKAVDRPRRDTVRLKKVRLPAPVHR